MLEMSVKLLLSILMVASIAILNFVVFRIPVRRNDQQIALIALLAGAANFYFKFMIDSSTFFLVQTFVYFLAILAVRRYPLLYALIVSGVGIIAVSIIDSVVTSVALYAGVSLDSMLNDLFTFACMHLVVSCSCVLLAYALYKWKLGFSFVVRRFSGSHSLNKHNFIWAALILLVVMFQQFASQHIGVLSVNMYFLGIITLAYTALILYSVHQNKKVLQDRSLTDKTGKKNIC